MAPRLSALRTRAIILRQAWSGERVPPLGVFGGEMAFRAVFFDVGDTLWHAEGAPPPLEFRRLATARARECLASLGIRFPDPAAASRVAWDAMEAAIRHARATGYAEPDYAEVTRAALAPLGLRMSAGQAGEFLESIYVSGVEGGKAAYPDARAALDTLRARGFRLAIVTNRAFGGARFRDDLASMGLDIDWEAIVVSVEVGFLKPHPAIFERALACLNLRPADALMVGNSLADDIAGAQQAGIAAAWRRSPPDAEGVVPEFAFTSLSDLAALPALARAR